MGLFQVKSVTATHEFSIEYGDTPNKVASASIKNTPPKIVIYHPVGEIMVISRCDLSNGVFFKNNAEKNMKNPS